MGLFSEELVRGVLLCLAALMACVVAIFGALGMAPGRLVLPALRWLSGLDLATNDSGKPGHETTALWVGYVLSSTALLVAAAQHPGSQIFLSLFYLLMTLIPIAELWLMLRTPEVGNTTRHSFDRPTVWLTRLAVSACLILLALSTGLGFVGWLPLQPKKFDTLSIDDAGKYPWSEYDRKQGLYVRHNIDEDASRLWLTITEHESVRNQWDVWFIVVREGTAKSPGTERIHIPTFKTAEDSFVYKDILLDRFREAGKDYVLEVRLHLSKDCIDTECTDQELEALEKAAKKGAVISIVESHPS